jgi:hypothetical protein
MRYEEMAESYTSYLIPHTLNRIPIYYELPRSLEIS